MNIVRLRSWRAYKQRVVDSYHAKSAEDRKLFWFRGQGSAAWPLLTTLDRFRKFDSDSSRNKCYESLLATFREEMIGLTAFRNLESEPLELLARHHGLPSALLDWTESPYIAAFFAFADSPGSNADVAIFALNRDQIEENRDFSIITNRELLRYNERALEQKGVFLRVNSIKMSVEESLAGPLTKYQLPQRQRETALHDLGSMGITARSLFRDLDGAAESAKTMVALNLKEEQ